MGLLENTLIILLLIAASAFFAIAEISLAAARKLKLEQLLDEGDSRAALVLRLQAQPGHFFTAVQIGLNAVAILAELRAAFAVVRPSAVEKLTFS